MKFENKSIEELKKLAVDACEAYEAGEPIMSDEEYDELRMYLGDENDAEIGSEELSKSNAYTVKHEFIMGSLDKVHTIRNDKGEVNFTHAVYDDKKRNAVVLKDLNMHISKAHGKFLETTPKFDGCSFDLVVKPAEIGSCLSLTCATRGDGQWGANILPHIMNSHFYDNFSMLEQACEALLVGGYDALVIRGEAVIKNSVYNRKYADKFKNSRVFVSGNLNREFDEGVTPKEKAEHEIHKSMCDDIDFVCYDYRRVNTSTGKYQELSWMNPYDETYELLKPYLGHIGQIPTEMCIVTPLDNGLVCAEDLEKLYWMYSEYRTHGSEYPLDGIVCKPECSARLENLHRKRAEDMIAIKFIVEKMQSTIEDIVWTVSQNGECYPKAIVKPVYYDGKEIRQTSLHGYSYLLEHNVGIGSEVTMVMNGDIIPGVDEVLSEGVIKMPDFPTYVKTKGNNSTPHLMKSFESEEELAHHQFNVSAKALVIDGIAEKTADKIWNACHNAYERKQGEQLFNLMQLMNNDVCEEILYSVMGMSKSVINMVRSLNDYRKKMKLSDIIRGLCIEGCGETTSVVCAKIISGLEYDISGLNEDAYSWALDESSENYKNVKKFQNYLNIENMKEEVIDNNGSEKIPVILTGVTTEAGYPTKAAWLAAHPQYTMVDDTKAGWSVCKILFTNDITSSTSKMKKAAKLGIEIRVYEE